MGVITYDPFPSVPAMSQDAQEFVENLLTEARTDAQSAVDTANTAISQLKNAVFPAELPEPPVPPTIQSSFTGALTGDFVNVPDLGTVSVALPTEFTPDAIVVPDIVSDIPTYVPLITGFSIPDAPTFVVPDVPTAPSIDVTFTVPDGPVADYGSIPSLYALSLPSFTAPTLAPFSADVPAFNVAPPNGTITWAEPAYQGQLTTSLKALLTDLLNNSTGIAPAVEQAIWERDVSRLDAANDRALDEVADSWAAKGFVLPPGPLLAATLAITRENQAKIAQASRDVAIKQADLEQGNRQFAVGKAIEFERLFVDIFLAVTQRSFEIAKLTVETQIQIFNANVAVYDVAAKIFQSKTEKYRVDLEYAQAQIQAYKAQLEAESIKGEINKELIAAFAAKISAFTAQVEAYKALVQAATARADLQKNKVELFRAQIEGVVAQVSEKKAEFDAYSARVGAEQAKATLEEANSRAFTARVGAITAVAEIQLKQTDAQIAVSGQKLAYAVANLNRLGELAKEQLAQIQARISLYEAFTHRGTAEFEATKGVAALNLQAQIEAAKVLLGQYGANIQLWTARVAQVTEFAKINAESLKATGTIAATLAAGALAGTSVSAGMSAGINRSEASSQSKSESHADSTSTSNSFSLSTTFDHRIESEE